MPFPSIRRLFASSPRNTTRSARRRPALECLEDRYTPSVAGAFDRSFSTDGQATFGSKVGGMNYDAATAVAVQADGKVVVVGTVTINNLDTDIGVVRYNRDGTVDRTFASGGRSFSVG